MAFKIDCLLSYYQICWWSDISLCVCGEKQKNKQKKNLFCYLRSCDALPKNRSRQQFRRRRWECLQSAQASSSSDPLALHTTLHFTSAENVSQVHQPVSLLAWFGGSTQHNLFLHRRPFQSWRALVTHTLPKPPSSSSIQQLIQIWLWRPLVKTFFWFFYTC